MCGIVGVFDGRDQVDKALLSRMCDSLAHRGPDARGLWFDQEQRLGFGHRRLAILDLSPSGHQPMEDKAEGLIVVFNGEIYNYLELKEFLIKKGYSFHTDSDTEVILKAYCHWGTDCLHYLNGMFAFCLYDKRAKKLFGARDRFGKKPFYYCRKNGFFAFSSEIKALLFHQKISRQLDLFQLNHYFAFGYTGNNASIYKEISKLPPAHAFVLDLERDNLTLWQYWDLLMDEDDGPKRFLEHDEDKLFREFHEIFTDAVKKRMISHVPLGAFLSGGIDSSLVVATMSRLSKEPVKTFSIGFEESGFSELPYARIVAKHFKTNHKEFILRPKVLEILPELVRHFDEPFGDPSLIPTYFVCKVTREYVTVALSGDGGDELFGGYSHYANALVAKKVASLMGRPLCSLVGRLSEFLPDSAKGKRELARLALSPDHAFVSRLNVSCFGIEKRKRLFSREVLEELGQELDAPERNYIAFLNKAKVRQLDYLTRITYLDARNYMIDDVLVKVDRMSMKVALETRAPLLDFRVGEFAMQKVPWHMKVRGRRTKYFLKEYAKRILPKELELERKQGFGLPLTRWFKKDWHDFSKEIFSGSDEFLDVTYVRRLLDEHGQGIEHGKRLFLLLAYFLWKDA